MKNFVSLFLILFVLWMLVGGIAASELILGGIVALILSYILSSYLKTDISLSTIPKLILFIILYIPVLLIELIKANLDVAKRVLDPNLPINPGIVKVPTALTSDFAKLILANSITLTPGTISIDADSENVYIHWIDVKGSTPDEYQEHVCSGFEKILRRIFND